MPALAKPRHEAFARAIVAGLVNATRESFSQGRAYVAAGYTAKGAGKSGGSAEVLASRMLKKVQHISERVRELQAEANARLEPELDVSRQRVGKRLDKASRIAEQQDNASAMATCELGIAKVFGHVVDKVQTENVDFSKATSLNDIGMQLLQSVGYASPSASDIALALDAHAAFTEQLEAIAERAQGLTSCNQ